MTRTLTLLGLSLLLAACGGGDDAATPGADGKTAGAKAGEEKVALESAAATEGARRYTVKSGIMEMKIDFMGDAGATIYFDDYGTKEANYTTMEMMGEKSQTVTINAGGWSSSFDPQKKTGTRTQTGAALAAMGGVPNLIDLTDEMTEKYQIKEIDDRTILGKEAQGVSMSMMGMSMRIWHWEGIPLRTEMDMGGEKPMVVEAVSLKTDVDVPAEKFVVPSDVVLTDRNAAKPGGM